MKCGHIIRGATCPLGTCYPLGKSHWAQQPLEFRAIIIFCKKKRKITAKNEQVKKCLKARRLLQNKSSSRHCNPCALSTMYTLLTEREATGWVLEVGRAIQLSIVSYQRWYGYRIDTSMILCFYSLTSVLAHLNSSKLIIFMENKNRTQTMKNV